MDTVVYMAIERYRRVKTNMNRLENSIKELTDLVGSMDQEQFHEYAAATIKEDDK